MGNGFGAVEGDEEERDGEGARVTVDFEIDDDCETILDSLILTEEARETELRDTSVVCTPLEGLMSFSVREMIPRSSLEPLLLLLFPTFDKDGAGESPYSSSSRAPKEPRCNEPSIADSDFLVAPSAARVEEVIRVLRWREGRASSVLFTAELRLSRKD